MADPQLYQEYVSFKHLGDSGQSSLDEMGEVVHKREDKGMYEQRGSMHQL